MKITKKKLYTFIQPEEKTVDLFFNDFNEKYEEIQDEHLIIDFSKNFNINLKDLFVFLKVSEKHRNKKLSFIIIVNGIDFDDLPDELIVAPTLTEAKDILEMEDIERDLGF
ncbi:MAG: ribonuclease Z [Flavobacteriaceae bacterium]|nr:ribonuclease Z [Flavobacteriaceae bacterium]